ncbi:hypothetical protein DFH29DRAFT_453554 [Suillus ampliporus]|nr:hypothetical protein DFH29DRAFT_453554 [Suillus ampliporus]
MSHLLPGLVFVLASQSFAVGANNVYLREPVFRFVRDDGNGDDDGDSSSSTTTTHTTSTTSTSSSSTTTSSSSTTTSSSSTTTSSSSTTTSSSSTTTSSSSTTTTQSSSSSTTTTTGTLTSFSSSSTSSSSSSSDQNDDGSTSTASQGLSTAARTGLAFGIMFFLILSALLVCYFRRRSRRTREKVSYGPALMSSEVGQYRPPDPVTSRERELPPPPRLDTTYSNSPDISHSPPLSAISSAVPLLSDPHRDSHSVSAWNRYSALSQAIDTQPITTQDVPILPNPHDPYSAPARSASYASTASSPIHTVPYGATLPNPHDAFTRSVSHASAASPPAHSIPYDASVPASAAMTSAFTAPAVDSSSSSQPQRRLSALHIDLTRHQKELELDHKKRSLDAQEPQDPPPQYSS